MPSVLDFVRGDVSLKEIKNMPVISQSQTDDLILEIEGWRVWHSRMTVADGSSCDNKVTVECFYSSKNRWEEIKTYAAR